MEAWVFYALLSAFFAAMTAIFSKAGLKDINPDLATAIRTAIILCITWVIVFFRQKHVNLAAISKNTWMFLILSGFATGLSWLFYFRALQLGKVSQVSVIDKGSIVFTILLSFLFLHETISTRVLVGAGLILAGMLILVWK
jgi:transporter family protein